MKAIQIQEFGGPDVLEYVELDDPMPGEGEVLVDVARSGVNFADTHATRNDYLAEQDAAADPRRRDQRPHPRRAPRRRAGRQRRLRREGRSSPSPC